MSREAIRLDTRISLLAVFAVVASCIVYCVTTSTKVDNLKETTSLEFLAIKSQIAVHQNVLDLRGQYGINANEKFNKLETDVAVSKDRIDKLEVAIVKIDGNIQKIADRIFNDKKTH